MGLRRALLLTAVALSTLARASDSTWSQWGSPAPQVIIVTATEYRDVIVYSTVFDTVTNCQLLISTATIVSTTTQLVPTSIAITYSSSVGTTGTASTPVIQAASSAPSSPVPESSPSAPAPESTISTTTITSSISTSVLQPTPVITTSLSTVISTANATATVTASTTTFSGAGPKHLQAHAGWTLLVPVVGLLLRL